MRTKERPIIMAAESIRAIYAQRKTQTRRVVKPQPEREDTFWKSEAGWFGVDETTKTRGPNLQCPYGQPGERLWVREGWRLVDADHTNPHGGQFAAYRADSDATDSKWKSPLFMPRWASRLLLEVVAVRVERLHQLSWEDARAEGVMPAPHRCPPSMLDPCPLGSKPESHSPARSDCYKCGYRDGWQSLNAKRGFPWDSNPWVWVVEFRRIMEAVA